MSSNNSHCLHDPHLLSATSFLSHTILPWLSFFDSFLYSVSRCRPTMCPPSLTLCNMCHSHSLWHALYLSCSLCLSSWQHVIEMVKHMKTWQMARGICASSSSLQCLSRCLSLQLELGWQLVIKLLRHMANGGRCLCFIIIIIMDNQTLSPPPSERVYTFGCGTEWVNMSKIWIMTLWPAHVVFSNRASLRNGICRLTRLRKISLIKCDV